MNFNLINLAVGRQYIEDAYVSQKEKLIEAIKQAKSLTNHDSFFRTVNFREELRVNDYAYDLNSHAFVRVKQGKVSRPEKQRKLVYDPKKIRRDLLLQRMKLIARSLSPNNEAKREAVIAFLFYKCLSTKDKPEIIGIEKFIESGGEELVEGRRVDKFLDKIVNGKFLKAADKQTKKEAKESKENLIEIFKREVSELEKQKESINSTLEVDELYDSIKNHIIASEKGNKAKQKLLDNLELLKELKLLKESKLDQGFIDDNFNDYFPDTILTKINKFREKYHEHIHNLRKIEFIEDEIEHRNGVLSFIIDNKEENKNSSKKEETVKLTEREASTQSQTNIEKKEELKPQQPVNVEPKTVQTTKNEEPKSQEIVNKVEPQIEQNNNINSKIEPKKDPQIQQTLIQKIIYAVSIPFTFLRDLFFSFFNFLKTLIK